MKVGDVFRVINTRRKQVGQIGDKRLQIVGQFSVKVVVKIYQINEAVMQNNGQLLSDYSVD